VASGYPFTHKILGILKDFDLIPSALKLNIPLSADDGQIHRILTQKVAILKVSLGKNFLSGWEINKL
jgi:hypothetical protein